MQVYDNGVAGIHIMGSQNFTFEATIAYQSNIYSGDFTEEGEGNVGSLDGQQPIEVIIEDSNLVTFNDMKVQSTNGENCGVPCSLAFSTVARLLFNTLPCIPTMLMIFLLFSMHRSCHDGFEQFRGVLQQLRILQCRN